VRHPLCALPKASDRDKAWSAYAMSCQGLGLLGIVAKGVISDVAGFANLRCTYTPFWL
jgi:hypothetical protein